MVEIYMYKLIILSILDLVLKQLKSIYYWSSYVCGENNCLIPDMIT